MLKKLISLLICSSVLLTILVGCGSGIDNDTLERWNEREEQRAEDAMLEDFSRKMYGIYGD